MQVERLTTVQKRIIISRAVGARNIARAAGLEFDLQDLIAEGYLTYVRITLAYDPRRGAAIETVLYRALNNQYRDLLRKSRAQKRRSLEVPYDPEKHDIPAPASELEYVELCEYYIRLMPSTIDQEVFREKVMPSEYTLALATMHQRRCAHLVERQIPIGTADAHSASLTAEVIARSLRYPVHVVRHSLSRIKKIVRKDRTINGG